jgi:retinol dehydrogenase 14
MPTSIVTGGNSGIGLETALGLARAGHRVVLAVRNPTKGQRAVDDLRARSGRDDIEQQPLDLASLASIRSFATDWAATGNAIDVLVNNAGVTMSTRHTTADGFEMTFGVNHLGHFLLTALLLDSIRAAGDGARIVTVASGAHKFARAGLDFDDLMFEHRTYAWKGMAAYGASKLANILFTRELARRLAGTGITANCVHPGAVATNLGGEGDGGKLGDLAMKLGRPFMRTPEQGARTSLHVALSPDVSGVTGAYFANSKPATTNRHGSDDAAAARLWSISEELVGLN